MHNTRDDSIANDTASVTVYFILHDSDAETELRHSFGR